MTAEQENITRTGLADDIVADLAAHGMLRDRRETGWGDGIDPITVIKARLVAIGLMPPEPQWKPGQFSSAEVVEFGWRVGLWGRERFYFVDDDGIEHAVRSSEVSAVEPVVVLDGGYAEEIIDDLRGRIAHSSGAIAGATAANLLRLIFAERGVDVR